MLQLADRVARCPTLREHHIWEAVKTLWPEGWEEALGPGKRVFAGLLDARGTVDAVLMMLALAPERRSVEAITNERGRWTCRVSAGEQPMPQFFGATHDDLAAAIFEAFLLSMTLEEETSTRCDVSLPSVAG